MCFVSVTSDAEHGLLQDGAKTVETHSETWEIGASELAEEEKTMVRQSGMSVEEAATAKIRT